MAIDKSKKVHAVGNLNSSQVRTVPYVFASEDLENYSAVELFYQDGVRKAKYATAEATEIYLVAAVEVAYDDEAFTQFYIGKDEGARTAQFDKGVRFETSNFAQISGTAPAKGQYASWDATAKTYQLSASAPSTPVGNKVFEVVDIVAGAYGFGQNMIRLETK